MGTATMGVDKKKSVVNKNLVTTKYLTDDSYNESKGYKPVNIYFQK